MTSTDHSNCRHPRTSKGRAACRKAGGPASYALAASIALRTEAMDFCTDCWTLALEVAAENLSTPDWDDWEVMTTARDYFFDRSALVACTTHSHLLD